MLGNQGDKVLEEVNVKIIKYFFQILRRPTKENCTFTIPNQVYASNGRLQQYF